MRELALPTEAKRFAERVVLLRSIDRPRSRAFGLLGLASALTEEGKPDEAAQAATEVLQMTETVGSYIVIQQFHDLRKALEPYHSNIAVREFLSRLDAALPRRLRLYAGIHQSDPGAR
jgi:hypothetical protein